MRAESRRQKAEGRKQKAESRRQKAEGGRVQGKSLASTTHRINSRLALLLYLTFAFCLLLTAYCLLPTAFCFQVAADQTIANQPASEGRVITPAGTLLLDATTRQPAVGALPVDLVRSPDATGPGGVENKIWLFRFRADGHPPVTPTNGSNTKVEAPFIDVNGFADAKANPRYNANNAPVYPTGLAISADGDTLYVANNLGDSLGVIRNLHGARRLEHIRLTGQSSAQTSTEHFIYPYGVVAATTGRGGAGASNAPAKVYVSRWNDASIAVVDTAGSARHVAYIPVALHPTKMLWDSTRARLFVVNSNADSVSVIDTNGDID